jgi:plastocyanin
MFTKILALFLFPALAAAQYGAPAPAPASSGSASSTSSSAAVAPTAPTNSAGQININVAFNGQLVFSPTNISAPVGTLVTFYFPDSAPLTHSVTQSTFANPCTYLAANTTSNASAGFDSGLQSAVTFTINITDTTPIWFFCKQVSHCSLGMVGSINAANDTNTYTEFRANAKALNGNETLTPDNGPVIAGVGATATGSPVSDISSSAASATSTSGALKVATSFGFALFAAVLAIVAIA